MAVRRSVLRLGVALVASGPFLMAACSGATDTGLFGAPATTDTSPTDPATSTAPSADPTTAPTATAAPDGGESDASVDGDAPSPTCTEEVEPDDTFDRATPFSTSFCGQLAGANDVDFGQFAVPQGATNLAITHTETGGKVAYRYYQNGVLLPVNAEIPATPGTVYGVSIRLAAGSKTDTPTYKLTVVYTYK